MGCMQTAWWRGGLLAAALWVNLLSLAPAADDASSFPPNRLRIRTGDAAAFSNAVRGPAATSGLNPETTALPTTPPTAPPTAPAIPAQLPDNAPAGPRPSSSGVAPPGEAVAEMPAPTATTATPATAVAPDADALQPIPDPQQGGHVHVQAASFNGVIPGLSTTAEVQKAWGTPLETRTQENTVYHLYRVDPFPRVEVAFRQDKVTSIVVRLEQAFPAAPVAQQLKLSDIRPVLISNELGEILGQAYPERGVLFAFQPSDGPGKASMMITQIILEPVSAEPFVLRAETTLESQPDLSLRDLEEALKAQPQNSRAHWLRARLLSGRGEVEPALAAAVEAVRLEPHNPRYLISQGQILGSLGRLNEAIPVLERAVQASESRPHLKARALCLLGDLHGSGAKPDYRQANDYHTQAIKVADPLASDPHPAVRLAAKEVLVDAHLGAAHDIAWGNWNQKEQSVPRWLKRASAFAEDLIQNEGGTPDYRLRVATRALAAVVGVEGKLDPTEWVEATLKAGQELLGSVSEPQKPPYQWTVGTALYDAVQIYQGRNEHDAALKYGEQAAEFMEKSLEGRPENLADRYLLGRLYFRLGIIHAEGRQNHQAAITWYEKAIPTLEASLRQVPGAELGRLGATFVSMGLSYWKAGQHDRAVTLTERGVGLMEKAAQEGNLANADLEIPYSNLAIMHRQMGRETEAGKYLQKAARTSAVRR